MWAMALFNCKTICNFGSNKLKQKMKGIQPLMKQKMLSKTDKQSDRKTDELSREGTHEALRIYIQFYGFQGEARHFLLWCN